MLSGMAALGCAVPLNLLCNLRGITDFSLPVRQDLNPLFKLKKIPLLCLFFSWLDWILLEGRKQVFRIMVTLYKHRVDKYCLRFSQLKAAFSSLWSQQLRFPNTRSFFTRSSEEACAAQDVWESPLAEGQVI